MTVLWLESGYTMKYWLSPQEIPRDFPRAQTIFHCIPLLLSQYSYNIFTAKLANYWRVGSIKELKEFWENGQKTRYNNPKIGPCWCIHELQFFSYAKNLTEIIYFEFKWVKWIRRQLRFRKWSGNKCFTTK